MKVQLIFFLAIVLHVSTRVTSLDLNIVTEGHRHHKKAPAYAPVKPPVHSPGKAQIYPPKKAPVYAPVKAPVYPPKNAPYHPPVKAPVYPPKNAPYHPPVKAPAHPPSVQPPAKSSHSHGNCISMCVNYCKGHHSKRECLRICVPCCDEFKCVPGPYKGCSNWDEVMYHGQIVKCPKY